MSGGAPLFIGGRCLEEVELLILLNHMFPYSPPQMDVELLYPWASPPWMLRPRGSGEESNKVWARLGSVEDRSIPP